MHLFKDKDNDIRVNNYECRHYTKLTQIFSRQINMKIIVFILFLLVTGCAQTQESIHLRTRMRTLDPNSLYFPYGSFNDGRADTFLIRWYSTMLIGLKEPILFRDTSKNEVCRFTWLRSFHHPISVRIEYDGESVTIYTKESNGAGGYEPGELITNNVQIIPIEQGRSFIDKLHKSFIWSSPSSAVGIPVDGAQWILEVKIPGTYKVMDKGSPERGDAFRTLCEQFLDMGGIKIKSKEAY